MIPDFSDIRVSIGPRPFRHGNSAPSEIKEITIEQVSIGPRLFRHGNGISNHIKGSIKKFQLGHVFSDMEIQNVFCRSIRREPVSIGPRLFRHGNISRCSGISPLSMMFQLGHVFSDMEIFHDAPGYLRSV